MFKLFRDSIFRPRRIIAYRAKPVWFVLLYVLIFVLITGFASSYNTLFYSEVSYAEKIDVSFEFKDTNSKIVNYMYTSPRNYSVKLGNNTYLFSPNEEQLKSYFLDGFADYVIMGDSFYSIQVFGDRYTIRKVNKLSYYSELFKNVDLSNLNENSEFFSALNAMIKKNKLPFFLRDALVAMAIEFATWIVIALTSYWFANIFFGAKNYMKKGQLFKMLIFATTAYNVAFNFIIVLGLTGFIQFVLVGVSLIPLTIFEREILMRIRLFQLSKGMIKDEDLANKLQELNDRLNNKDNENKDGE